CRMENTRCPGRMTGRCGGGTWRQGSRGASRSPGITVRCRARCCCRMENTRCPGLMIGPCGGGAWGHGHRWALDAPAICSRRGVPPLLPEGKHAVSGSRDRTLRRWDLETGQQVGEALTCHARLVGGPLLLPDGKHALSWSDDRTLRRWDLEIRQVGEPFGHGSL